jgi:spermidine/putrescine-binding protein
VWEKIREARANALKFYKSGAEQMSLFSSGDFVVADGWDGRVMALQREGKPIGWHSPDGAMLFSANMFVVKGSPMDEAYQFLNFILEPEINAPLIFGGGYASSLDPKKVKPHPQAALVPSYDPTGEFAGKSPMDPVYWAKNSDAWQLKYTQVMSS